MRLRDRIENLIDDASDAEGTVLEFLKEKSLIAPKWKVCIGDLVPLMALVEARYYDKYTIDNKNMLDVPRPLLWTIALCLDSGKIAAYSSVGFGIYRGLESLQQLFQ